MTKKVLSEVPLRMRRNLVRRTLGTKQLILGSLLFLILTLILAVNVLPPDYIMEPIGLKRLAGTALFVFAILVLSGLYLYQFRPSIFQRPSLLVLLALITVIITVFAKALAIPVMMHAAFWGYLIPVAFVAMLVTALFDPYLAIMVVVSSSLFAGIATGDSFTYTAVGIIGGTIAIYAASDVNDRFEFTKAGFVTGSGLAVFCMAISLMDGTMSTALINSVAGFVNGLLSAILALGIMPFLERHFGIVTPMRLLNLSNPNQPLLKKLMVEAPGTYSHSVAVSNLAEAAAQAIGADPLLVRVGAYYHDVGKVKRPAFYAENQATSGDKHQDINPQLSSLVIISHVKEGVDIAEQYKLPQPIIDLINEHHGTGLVTFFYHQARKLEQKSSVEEETFRYQGNKPRSREAAILMLADATEAASKTARRLSLAKFEEMTKNLIRERLEDGQLDESDLTLADLNKIVKSFAQTLAGLRHMRVPYPVERSGQSRPRSHRGLGGNI